MLFSFCFDIVTKLDSEINFVMPSLSVANTAPIGFKILENLAWTLADYYTAGNKLTQKYPSVFVFTVTE